MYGTRISGRARSVRTIAGGGESRVASEVVFVSILRMKSSFYDDAREGSQ